MVSGYEDLIPTLNLPDTNDRHVLAAAIHGGASVIVIANIRHSPAEALAPYKIVAQEPDSFVLGLLEAATAALAVDRARLLRPAMNAAEYIASLERAGLSATAAVLRAFADAL